MSAKEDENIIVVVRCRPFSEKEKLAGHSKICSIDTQAGSVVLTNPKSPSDVKTFVFDASFDEDCTQTEVYNRTARRIVDAVLEGFNGTVFAYGQTGTGKTFSMQGIPHEPNLRGIIPNSFHHIFNHIGQSKEKTFLVRVSFLEIYNEDIRDLLIKKSTKQTGLDIKENPESGVYVKDLSSFVVKSVEEMEKFMDFGNSTRSVGATLMNATSSRSHSIFTITIESSDRGLDGEERFIAGKLHLVDLAGSERQSKTGAAGDRLKEATKINLSLSALGNCISALVDGKSSHIPYRDSKLTPTMSPASYNFDESLSSLRYANRAKNIKNKPKINEDPKDALLREYSDEINRLKAELELKKNGLGNGQINEPLIISKKVIKKVVKIKKVLRKKEKVDGENENQSEVEEEEEEDESETVVSDNGNQIVEKRLLNPLASMDQQTIDRLQKEVEAEKKALLASKDMVVEQKQRVAAELESRAKEIEEERKSREEMAEQLKAVEEKLLIGGVNIFDHVNAQQKELEETQVKLQERAEAERKLKEQLELKQEKQLQKEENYNSLQEEVDIKSKKLKKLWQKLQVSKQEINDLMDEFRNEREDLLDTIRELSRELGLKLSIINNFIPKEDRLKIEERAIYDEENEEWCLAPLSSIGGKYKRPCSVSTLHRPTCQYAKSLMVLDDPSFRYRGENLISLKLDLPERTTIEVESMRQPSSEQKNLQGALDFALGNENDEIFVNEDHNPLVRRGTLKQR
ncbi:Kinesin-like protein kif3b [Clydaea vesicula]|uniref:Kinesin-like protein n=1 Tax=Clydaea vesicula TaxID=447962 RepID=A0AAD5UAL0_9FUNG|nr:Kinesin-like protein kif3b [Clydaea vesicula]